MHSYDAFLKYGISEIAIMNVLKTNARDTTIKYSRFLDMDWKLLCISWPRNTVFR